MSLLTTLSGKKVNPQDPTPDSISLIDIAQGLAYQSRFAGQLGDFYSVAQHSVLVSKLVVPSERSSLPIRCLFHDAHEAYMSDIPSPVKELLKPSVSEIEHRFDEAIYEHFKLAPFESGSVNYLAMKRADQLAFYLEDHWYRGGIATVPDSLLTSFETFKDRYEKPLDPQAASIQFTNRYLQLTGQ